MHSNSLKIMVIKNFIMKFNNRFIYENNLDKLKYRFLVLLKINYCEERKLILNYFALIKKLGIHILLNNTYQLIKCLSLILIIILYFQFLIYLIWDKALNLKCSKFLIQKIDKIYTVNFNLYLQLEFSIKSISVSI